MKFAGLILILLIPASNAVPGEKCRCVPAPLNEATHYGGNRLIVFHETKSYPSLQGVVLDQSGAEMQDVLIEVFDHPEWLLLGYPEFEKARQKQRKIAACKTGADGRFCFAGLPHGKYELRCSFGPGMNGTHVHVTIAGSRIAHPRRSLRVTMSLGT